MAITISLLLNYLVQMRLVSVCFLLISLGWEHPLSGQSEFLLIGMESSDSDVLFLGPTFLWHFQMKRETQQRNIQEIHQSGDNSVDAVCHNLPGQLYQRALKKYIYIYKWVIIVINKLNRQYINIIIWNLCQITLKS